jgi:hypothetical protein
LLGKRRRGDEERKRLHGGRAKEMMAEHMETF